MKQQIINYLVNENHSSSKTAEILFEKISKHQDIYSEFCLWLNNRKFPDEEENAINIEGFTAKMINERFPSIHGIGVYNILVGLKDHPEITKKRIKDGYSIK